MFVGKAEKVVRKIASQVHCKGGCSNSTNLQEVFRFMSCRLYNIRDDRLEAKTRRKRWVDFVKAKRAKLKLTQVRGSVLEFVDQFYAF